MTESVFVRTKALFPILFHVACFSWTGVWIIVLNIVIMVVLMSITSAPSVVAVPCA